MFPDGSVGPAQLTCAQSLIWCAMMCAGAPPIWRSRFWSWWESQGLFLTIGVTGHLNVWWNAIYNFSLHFTAFVSEIECKRVWMVIPYKAWFSEGFQNPYNSASVCRFFVSSSLKKMHNLSLHSVGNPHTWKSTLSPYMCISRLQMCSGFSQSISTNDQIVTHKLKLKWSDSLWFHV